MPKEARRSSISKKIRFEVFKRDGFRCSYCGKNPPGVVLEVDHIDPKSKGGSDDPNNLITSCFDCNRGKRDIPLQRITPTIQENLEVLRDQEEQLKEYRRFIKKIDRRIKSDIEEVNIIYSNQYPGWSFSERFKNVSLRIFIKSLPVSEVSEALHIAISKFPNNRDRVINYFCGICWHKIRKDHPAEE